MREPFVKWEIPNEYLDAESDKRKKVVIVSKEAENKPIVYQALLSHIKAPSIDIVDAAFAPSFPVAVYKLDVSHSKNRPFNYYIYQGDTLR